MGGIPRYTIYFSDNLLRSQLYTLCRRRRTLLSSRQWRLVYTFNHFIAQYWSCVAKPPLWYRSSAICFATFSVICSGGVEIGGIAAFWTSWSSRMVLAISTFGFHCICILGKLPSPPSYAIIIRSVTACESSVLNRQSAVILERSNFCLKYRDRLDCEAVKRVKSGSNLPIRKV